MITVDVECGATIRSVSIHGHALFAEYGQDIVCAAVSAIAIGGCNALDQLAQDSCFIEIQDNRITIEARRPDQRLELLLQMLLIELECVAQSYPDHVTIRKESSCDSH